MKDLVSGVNQRRNPKGRNWLDQVRALNSQGINCKRINRQAAKERQGAKKHDGFKVESLGAEMVKNSCKASKTKRVTTPHPLLAFSFFVSLAFSWRLGG